MVFVKFQQDYLAKVTVVLRKFGILGVILRNSTTPYIDHSLEFSQCYPRFSAPALHRIRSWHL